jgi:hypothetical protein
VSKKRDTRYAHAFSKGRGVRFTAQGSWRPQAPCTIRTETVGTPVVAPAPRPPGGGAETPAPKPRTGHADNVAFKQRSGGAKAPALANPALKQRSDSANDPALKQRSDSATKMTSYPVKLDPKRWTVLKVSPTVANLHKSCAGMAVICADCLHGVGHRNPGLPDRFRHQWHLTLLELEKKCRCEMCGSRNARIYPWWGNDPGGELGLEGPPGEGR